MNMIETQYAMFICIFECFFLVEVLYSDFIIDLLRKELKFSFCKLIIIITLKFQK